MSVTHHPTHDTIRCDTPGCRLNMYNPPGPGRTADERWRAVGGVTLPDGRHACTRSHALTLTDTPTP